MNVMWRSIVRLILLVFILAPVTLRAHEIRPGYLEISDDNNHNVHVLWKQPIMGEVAIRLVPHLSSGWLDQGQTTFSNTDAYLIREWTIPNSGVALTGQTVTIEGLDRTMTDVLLHITFADGGTLTKMLRPLEPSFRITRETKESVDRLGYFRLGVEHVNAKHFNVGCFVGNFHGHIPQHAPALDDRLRAHGVWPGTAK